MAKMLIGTETSYDYKENYYALMVAILRNVDCDEAFLLLKRPCSYKPKGAENSEIPADGVIVTV